MVIIVKRDLNAIIIRRCHISKSIAIDLMFGCHSVHITLHYESTLELFLVGHPAKGGRGAELQLGHSLLRKPATRNGLARGKPRGPQCAMADLLCLRAIDIVTDEIKDAPMSLD